MRALEEVWKQVLDERIANLSVRADLAECVRKLSAAYNGLEAWDLRSNEALAARVAFSFPRDVPKVHAAVREVVRAGLLGDRSRDNEPPLRLLDVGAGLGASTLGFLRALRFAGITRPVEATLVDDDAKALQVAIKLLTDPRVCDARATFEHRVSPSLPTGPFDVAVIAQVFTELDQEKGEDERVARQASFLVDLAGRLDPAGTIVVVEPALKRTARRLQQTRDRLLSLDSGLSVFAPCTRSGACPLLVAPTDWCHEDLPVDLPEWVAPLARAAGLRFQGLTFSYLVLRRDGRTLRDHLDANRPFRAVSSLVRTKGKREVMLCGDAPPAAPGDEAGLVRVMRTDREARDENRDLDALTRGDLFKLDGDPRGRVRIREGDPVTKLSVEARTL